MVCATFPAYETVCYAYRSERCTVYAVPSAQVSCFCLRAFSSFANLHLDFFLFLFRIKVYFNVDSILTCFWALRELYIIDRFTVQVRRKNTSAHMPSPSGTRLHMGRPVARPVKSMGRPTEMAGQPVQSPCFMGLAANVMGRAGPTYLKI